MDSCEKYKAWYWLFSETLRSAASSFVQQYNVMRLIKGLRNYPFWPFPRIRSVDFYKNMKKSDQNMATRSMTRRMIWNSKHCQESDFYCTFFVGSGAVEELLMSALQRRHPRQKRYNTGIRNLFHEKSMGYTQKLRIPPKRCIFEIASIMG